jgi:hypothetical protein
VKKQEARDLIKMLGEGLPPTGFLLKRLDAVADIDVKSMHGLRQAEIESCIERLKMRCLEAAVAIRELIITLDQSEHEREEESVEGQRTLLEAPCNSSDNAREGNCLYGTRKCVIHGDRSELGPGEPEWMGFLRLRKRLWREDECSRHDPGALHLGDGWRDLFGTEYPKGMALDGFDGGDCMYELHPGDIIACHSIHGDEILGPRPTLARKGDGS